MIFGNPSWDSIQLVKNSQLIKEWGARGIFDSLKVIPYPDERASVRELWMLVAMSTTMDSVREAYVQRLDEDLFGVMSEYIGSYGVTTSAEEINAVIAPYEPIIDYLKLIYNRPRPHQLAGALGIPLYPRIKTYSPESSYPGGHTLFSLFFYHIYGARHPDLKPQLMKFVLDTKLSREQAGVHYPSDGVFSFQIYRHLQPFMDTYDTINRPT